MRKLPPASVFADGCGAVRSEHHRETAGRDARAVHLGAFDRASGRIDDVALQDGAAIERQVADVRSASGEGFFRVERSEPRARTAMRTGPAPRAAA
jgi:hypothetical protein